MSSEDMQKLKEESKRKLAASTIVKVYNEINGTNFTPSTLLVKLYKDVCCMEIGDDFYKVFSKLSGSWNEKLKNK